MTVPAAPVSVYSAPHPPLISGRAVSRRTLKGTFILAPGCDTSTKRAYFLT